MLIKIKWHYASGEYDTKTMKLHDLPARGHRPFGRDEMDAQLCINDLSISLIHLGDVESSNALCAEIVRRFNEFPEELKK